jgi:hypothetical protein
MSDGMEVEQSDRSRLLAALRDLEKLRADRDEYLALLHHFADESEDHHNNLPAEERRMWMDRLDVALGYMGK